MMASAAAAENAAPSYQGDPETYKVVFEDPAFRVIVATWKKGATDKPHSHPVPFVVYPLDDCKIRVHNPDGSTQERESKAGTVFAGPITASHQAENVSANDCHAVFVERK
jgi:quercetin dioxygenase-like cupin family protein